MQRAVPFNCSPNMPWSNLFFNCNMDKSIVMTGTDSEDNSETIEIRKDDSSSFTSFINDKSTEIPEYIKDNFIENFPQSLKLTYQTVMDGKEETQEAHYILNEDKITIIPRLIIPTKSNKSLLYCSNQTYHPDVVNQWYNDLFIDKNKQKLLKLLKLIDPRIVDTFILNNKGSNSLYCDIESKLYSTKMLPLKELGQGINRLIMLIFLLNYKPGAILLVDEIEQYFHHSFLPQLWKIISDIIDETKCQIIATTYSYECIKALQTINKAKQKDDAETNNDRICFLRLDEIDGQIIPKVFNEKILNNAINFNFEVR
jgi:AAA15 family ATPase/GTPase